MKDFFLDKFEYDWHTNKLWCKYLIDQEDRLSSFAIRSMSHILNVHHIWNMRLIQENQESSTWDVLPVSYFERLVADNYQTTVNYLEHYELTEKINYHDSEGVLLKKNAIDILYHILNHSNYHRAQIILDMKQLNLSTPSSNFIVFK